MASVCAPVSSDELPAPSHEPAMLMSALSDDTTTRQDLGNIMPRDTALRISC